MERANIEVMKHLRALIHNDQVKHQLSKLLPRVQYVINTSYHSALGMSPMELVYGNRVTKFRSLLSKSNGGKEPIGPAKYLENLQTELDKLIEISKNMLFNGGLIRWRLKALTWMS